MTHQEFIIDLARTLPRAAALEEVSGHQRQAQGRLFGEAQDLSVGLERLGLAPGHVIHQRGVEAVKDAESGLLLERRHRLQPRLGVALRDL
jgi:hypothetical protein